MRKIVLVSLTVIILGASVVSEAAAGELCWQVTFEGDEFIDEFIKVAATTTCSKKDSPPCKPSHKALNGIWYKTDEFRVSVYGTFEKDMDPSKKHVALTAPASTEGFESCTFEAFLDKKTKEGPYQVSCDVGTFFEAGNLVKIDCADAGPIISPTAPADGRVFETSFGQR